MEEDKLYFGQLPAARVEDFDSGHDCCPPRKCIVGSPSVLINGRPAAMVGSVWMKHGCPPHMPVHFGVTQKGSPTVKINGVPASRVGDSVICGNGEFLVEQPEFIQKNEQILGLDKEEPKEKKYYGTTVITTGSETVFIGDTYKPNEDARQRRLLLGP